MALYVGIDDHEKHTLSPIGSPAKMPVVAARRSRGAAMHSASSSSKASSSASSSSRASSSSSTPASSASASSPAPSSSASSSSTAVQSSASSASSSSGAVDQLAAMKKMLEEVQSRLAVSLSANEKLTTESRTTKAKCAVAEAVLASKKQQDAAAEKFKAPAAEEALGESEYAEVALAHPSTVHIAYAGRRTAVKNAALVRADKFVQKAAEVDDNSPAEDAADRSNDDDIDDEVEVLDEPPKKKKRLQPNRKRKYKKSPAEKSAIAVEKAGKYQAIPKSFSKMPRDNKAEQDGEEWDQKGTDCRNRMLDFNRQKMKDAGFEGLPLSAANRVKLEFKLADVVTFFFLYSYHLC